MLRGIRLFGYMFILVGTLLLLGFCVIGYPQTFRHTHLAMGGIFGGLHLAYGIYLYFTEKKNFA